MGKILKETRKYENRYRQFTETEFVNFLFIEIVSFNLSCATQMKLTMKCKTALYKIHISCRC